MTEPVGTGCGGREAPSCERPVAAATAPDAPADADGRAAALGDVAPADAPMDPDAQVVSVPGQPVTLDGRGKGATMSTAASTGPPAGLPGGPPPRTPATPPPDGALMPGKTGAPDGAVPHVQEGMGVAPVAVPPPSIGWQPVGVISWPGQT